MALRMRTCWLSQSSTVARHQLFGRGSLQNGGFSAERLNAGQQHGITYQTTISIPCSPTQDAIRTTRQAGNEILQQPNLCLHVSAQGSNLFYFKGSSAAKPLGFIPLEGAIISAERLHANSSASLQHHMLEVALHPLHAQGSARAVYVLAASTPELQELWWRALAVAAEPGEQLPGNREEAEKRALAARWASCPCTCL